MVMNHMICFLSLAMLLSHLGVVVLQHRHLETIVSVSVINHQQQEQQIKNALIDGSPSHSRRIRRNSLRNTVPSRGLAGLNADRYQNSKKRLLVHLHIGKTGCSSLELMTPRLARDTNRTLVPPAHVHFDWSFIDTLPQDKIDVITMLRYPVSCTVSQFYYAKTLQWTRNKPIGKMNLGE